jgi:hypothetical protein
MQLYVYQDDILGVGHHFTTRDVMMSLASRLGDAYLFLATFRDTSFRRN